MRYSRLAELMLPDGAHLRPEDWTILARANTFLGCGTAVIP
jgi:hypothetical protein